MFVNDSWRFRFFSLALALLLIVGLTACAGETQASSRQPSSPSEEQASSREEQAAGIPAVLDFGGKIPPWRERESNEPVTVRVYFTSGMTGIANQYALAQGWYDDAGIEIVVVETSSPVSAYGAGEIDFADGDPGTYIPAIANGVPFKIVANMWRNRGAYWIIASNDIESFEDLRGKTIGVSQASGGMRLTTIEVLSQHGITVDDVELVANGSRQEAYATLLTGEVDATIIHQPYATIAEFEGTGHPLARTWEYLPDYHTGVVTATEDLIDNHPETVERMLEVYFFVNDYARNNLDDFIPWAAEYLNISEEEARHSIESELELWENDPVVDISRLQVTQDLLYKHEMQRESYPVDNVVDNTFAESVAQKLGLGAYATGEGS